MRRRRIQVGCDFTYLAAIDTPVVFQVQPRGSAPGVPGDAGDGGDNVVVSHERWSLRPQLELRRYTDLYGNPCSRAVLPAGRCRVGYHAVADVPDATEDADSGRRCRPRPTRCPTTRLIYTLPSRYCLPDVLADEAWSRFGALAPGYRRVQAICDYVHGHLEFGYGSSTALSTAADVNAAGRGVCRDFTHLAISFCRALNIPARYVFGYLPDMDVPPGPGADGLRRLDGGLARRPVVDL